MSLPLPTGAPLVDVLTVAQRVLVQDLAERLADEDATVDQWRALRAIGAAQGVSMGELGETLQIPAPSLTRLVDSLVDRASVYRRQSEVDRRRVDVHLSQSGRAALARLEAIARAHERSVAEALGVERVSQTVETLARLVPPTRPVPPVAGVGAGSSLTP